MSLQELTVALKAARPKMSLDLVKAKTAQEVGKLIADSWYGYGLKDSKAEGDTYSLTVEAKPDVFKDAFTYLWLKPKGDENGATIYRMMGSPFEILVKVTGNKHDITVRKSAG